jgi:hypothetical protein
VVAQLTVNQLAVSSNLTERANTRVVEMVDTAVLEAVA